MPRSRTALICLFSLLTLNWNPVALAEDTPAEDITGAVTSSGLSMQELRRFVEVYDRIKKAYVEDISDADLLNNAIRGMLAGLDPHSAYLEPQAFEDLQENTRGEFGGLGIEVGLEDGFIRVIAPIADTPADKAGVEAGDLIIKLDDQPVKGMDLTEAVNAMRGPPGTSIRLTIIRTGAEGPIEIDVTRAIIRSNSVRRELLEGAVGLVRVSQFQAQTGADFDRAIATLRKEAGGRLNGLILDLRNNPGGVLQAAVDVSDSLLEEGLVVYTEGRIKSSRLRFSAGPGDILEGAPVVVLINAGSASASEIVAGALQDHRRALIMGEASFGKGSVQTVLPLDEDYGLKLTTARYYTPSGSSIQALGITPDIIVPRARLTEVDDAASFKERDLNRHLSNEEGEPAPVPDDASDTPSTGSLITSDYQLREAYNVLRGLAILNPAAKESE